MAFNHITANQGGMAGRQLVGNAVFILYGLNVIGNDVLDIKVIFFQMLQPSAATTTACASINDYIYGFGSVQGLGLNADIDGE